MKHFSAFIILAVAILMPVLCSAAVPTPTASGKPAKPPAAASLEVVIRLDGTTGAKNRARNLQVFVCRQEVIEEIRSVRKTGSIIAQQSGQYQALLSDLPFMAGRAAKASVAEMITDQKGHGTFTNLQPGSYILFASYHDSTGAGYWMLPVTVTPKKKTRITLSRTNTTEYVQNK
jgi:hypothetical protein